MGWFLLVWFGLGLAGALAVLFLLRTPLPRGNATAFSVLALNGSLTGIGLLLVLFLGKKKA